MSLGNTAARWGGFNKFMHWALFLVLAGVFITVNIAMGLEKGDPTKGLLMMLHKSFAVTVLVLMVIWRVKRAGSPRPEPYGAAWQVRLSQVVQWAIILLALFMPIGGFLMSQFFESPLVLFNLIQVPQILPGNEELGGVLMSMHRIAGPTFFFIILAHIAGALWHHFIDKDETLKRMLPGGGK